MAGLVVEDGTLVSGANSYISAADARAYLDLRGITTPLTDGQLIQGADYINSFRSRFKGTKRSSASSSMQFPRTDVTIDDVALPEDVIPQVIPDAQVQAALEIQGNKDPLSTIQDRPVRKQKLGSLEIEYDTSGTGKLPTYTFRKILSLLRPLLDDNFGRVSR